MTTSQKSSLYLEFSKIWSNMAICNLKMSKYYDPNNLFDVHLPNDAIECLDNSKYFLELSKQNFSIMGSSDINIFKISHEKIDL